MDCTEVIKNGIYEANDRLWCDNFDGKAFFNSDKLLMYTIFYDSLQHNKSYIVYEKPEQP